MLMKNRKFWGWGYTDYQIDQSSIEQMKQMMHLAFGMKDLQPLPIPTLDEISLRPPRFVIPDHLKTFLSDDVFERASHSFGKSYRDIWRGLYGKFDNPPDYVAFPKTESNILELMEFCAFEGIDMIPFGGGSSVVGGVEPKAESFGVITVDMRHFDQVLSIDRISRTARIQAGIYGPSLESNLKPHGLTLRHFPQSFEFSTLGGWIATRSGGHFATLFTHIEEFVQSVRVVTPSGIMDTRKLPGSGAGPSEERFIAGSEGTLGIITEATMRLQDIPIYKTTQSVRFASWDDGVEASRELSQSGLFPSNARLISPMEAFTNGLGNGQDTVLIVGFESHDHTVDRKMSRALEICTGHGGKYDKVKTGRSGSADRWKRSFLQAPYLRDELMKYGLIVETFETAIPWDQFAKFHRAIESAANRAIQEQCGAGFITCRFTHLYPDGPAPYYSIFAKGRQGEEINQWDKIKSIVSQTIIDNGGTITHHHAVGKDHEPYYTQQISQPFYKMLYGAKTSIDPNWIMNPGTLINKASRN
ncbi:MAG: FAD-binding oxidoreductase [Bacteroidia bacterium]|nr:FAD-binding oxidoreductase [Bacteroidia bacterium]